MCIVVPPRRRSKKERAPLPPQERRDAGVARDLFGVKDISYVCVDNSNATGKCCTSNVLFFLYFEIYIIILQNC